MSSEFVADLPFSKSAIEDKCSSYFLSFFKPHYVQITGLYDILQLCSVFHCVVIPYWQHSDTGINIRTVHYIQCDKFTDLFKSIFS